MLDKDFDAIVIGGGLFGCYAALHFAKKGEKVALIEKEQYLLNKASLINQGRIHGGYHYPRSIETAMQSNEYKKRFLAEHKMFINSTFNQYYGIDKNNSKTSPDAFENFCEKLDLFYKKNEIHFPFKSDPFSALYLTEEYSFNPKELANFYRAKIDNNPFVSVFCNSTIIEVHQNGETWQISITSDENNLQLKTPIAVNATYSALNTINNLFGQKELDLTYELSEIALVRCDDLKNKGLTVIDGPFVSIMPYGNSNLFSLSSVIHTHHKKSDNYDPTFDCQLNLKYCQPKSLGICNKCVNSPTSNFKLMKRQLSEYLSENIKIEHVSSDFTVKAKLKESGFDDARPTVISKIARMPTYINVFAGKVSSIYELENYLGFL